MMRPPKESFTPTGVTLIYPVPEDADGFYQRLLLSGLRLAPVPVHVSLSPVNGRNVLVARNEACTGYLFATDGIEAPESDLFRFLSQELSNGERLTISGRYAPDPGTVIETESHFLMLGGRLMTSERRVMTGPGGERTLLRSRSDLSHDNIVPLAVRGELAGVSP
ncbi:hypothetical protein IQ03_01322 [Gemmobacter caeni]|jgi:hypothetical protein|uniref:Uncharacterized protein n=1 Tax=Gemmobacter caeni TaxID=589035 RepID=A0A2T6B8P3_9RHOB|nr:hypothetical protein [Gemmobacter caeni]PTX52426.1 hypothetical protein C8N34_102205 [Gemmobacter caeni]TWJ02903.1 hypothetical protein IQ03_01322 [Gemmobacter caeni]